MHARSPAPVAVAPLGGVPVAPPRAAAPAAAEAAAVVPRATAATSAVGRALVAAIPGDQSHSALLRFCVASMHKEQILGAAGAERRRQREQVKTYSTLLEEHMRRHNEGFVHLPASASSPECWVVRRPVRAAPKKLCAATVVDTLRALSLEQLQRVTAETLSSAVEDVLRSSLSRQATGRFSVAVQTHRPRPAPLADPRAVPAQPHGPLAERPGPEPGDPASQPAQQAPGPSATLPCPLEGLAGAPAGVAPTSVCAGVAPTPVREGAGPRTAAGPPPAEEARRLAGALRACRDEAKAGAKGTRELLRVHEAAAKLCEPVVEAYVQSVSPTAAAAPVQVEVAGATTDFFVRARNVSHKKVITLTKLLPLCLGAVKAALGAVHMVDAVTPRALAYLQSTVGLDDVFQRLQADLDKEQAASTTTKREVSLDRGALRPRRQGRGGQRAVGAPAAGHRGGADP